jgi:hypothetical protein
MAGAQAFSSIAVVVLVKEQAVTPVWVSLEFLVFSEASSTARLIASKNPNHSFRNFFGHALRCDGIAAIGWFHNEVRAKRLAEPQQGMDQEIRSWEPHWAAPI